MKTDGLQRTFALAILGLVALVASNSGCSKSPHDVAHVRGTVTIDGQPFTQGKVMFAPVAGGDNLHPGKAAMGLLQSDGSFILSTYGKGDGAVVGEHSVTIIYTDSPPAAPTFTSADAASVKAPPKFDRARVPGNLQVVADQENHFDIKLSRQDVERYRKPK